MKSPIDVRILGGGQNWMPLCTRIALGLDGYYGLLPSGSTVSVTTREPGRNCFEAPALVASGQYHMAITTPAWTLDLAVRGQEPYSEPLELCSLARFPHDDRLVFAVRRETGITSIAEIRDRKYPLKVSTPLRETRHPGVWCAEKVLEEYGFNFDDIEAWGGRLLRDRPRSQNVPNVEPVNPEFDAIFDEAIMTRRWKTLTGRYDMRFLPVDADVLRRLEGKGWRTGVLPKGYFPTVETDVPTVDFSGWILFCRRDMSDELAYLTIKAIDEQKNFINHWFAEPSSGMTRRLEMAELCRDLSVPLHPGARRYYSECGYL